MNLKKTLLLLGTIPSFILSICLARFIYVNLYFSGVGVSNPKIGTPVFWTLNVLLGSIGVLAGYKITEKVPRLNYLILLAPFFLLAASSFPIPGTEHYWIKGNDNIVENQLTISYELHTFKGMLKNIYID